MKFFLLLFINYFLFIFSYITIHFKTDFPKEKITIDNFYNLLKKNKIYFNIKIGTPFQNLPIYIKLSQYPFYISSNLINSNKIKTFNINNSNSFNFYNYSEHSYIGQEYINNLYGSDIININDEIYHNFDFILVTEMDETLTESGVLGLKLGKTFIDIIDRTNFIYQLKQKDIINNYHFSIIYNNENEGILYIGAPLYDILKDNYDICNYFQVNSISDSNSGVLDLFSFEVDYVYIDNYLINNSNEKIICVFDIESYFYLAGNSFKEFYEEKFFNKLIENKKCIKNSPIQTGLTFFICDFDINLNNFPSINLYIKSINYNFTLDKNDLFYKSGKKLFFILGFLNYYEKILLGKYFFKKYSITFNQDSKKIGFYINKNVKNNKKRNEYFLIYLILLILILIILIFIFFYLFRIINKRKKKAFELIEDFEYKTSYKLNLK